MEDSKIVALYLQRNENAIKQTQAKYEHYLHKIAFQILVDQEDAQESVNDTYFAAWNAIPPHEPRVLSTFLGKLTRRISIDKYRKRTSAKRGGSEYAISLSELEDCLPDNYCLEEQVEGKLLGKKISEFLRTVSSTSRVCFVERYFYMKSIEDISRNYGLTRSNVKTLLHRTRISLKQFLEKEGFL